MPISFPGKEQKAAEGRRDHRSVKWEDERRESTGNWLSYHRCLVSVCSLPWKRAESPERQGGTEERRRKKV